MKDVQDPQEQFGGSAVALASPCAARRVGGFLAMGLAERCAVVKPSQRWRLALSLISLVLVDQRPTLSSLHKGAAIGKQKGKVTSENGGSETACFGWTVLLANSITKFVNLHVVSRVSATSRTCIASHPAYIYPPSSQDRKPKRNFCRNHSTGRVEHHLKYPENENLQTT